MPGCAILLKRIDRGVCRAVDKIRLGTGTHGTGRGTVSVRRPSYIDHYQISANFVVVGPSHSAGPLLHSAEAEYELRSYNLRLEIAIAKLETFGTFLEVWHSPVSLALKLPSTCIPAGWRPAPPRSSAPQHRDPANLLSVLLLQKFTRLC